MQVNDISFCWLSNTLSDAKSDSPYAQAKKYLHHYILPTTGIFAQPLVLGTHFVIDGYTLWDWFKDSGGRRGHVLHGLRQ